MKKVLLLLLVCTLLALTGCAKMIAPSDAEIAQLDYGTYPENYEEIVKRHMATRLKDPYSAVYSFYGTPHTRWLQSSPLFGGELFYGWGGEVHINAKNSFGAYTGGEVYIYIIRNNSLIVLEPKKHCMN